MAYDIERERREADDAGYRALLESTGNYETVVVDLQIMFHAVNS